MARSVAERRTGVFINAPKAEQAPVIDVKMLHAKIGELALENNFLFATLDKVGLLPSVKR